MALPLPTGGRCRRAAGERRWLLPRAVADGQGAVRSRAGGLRH